jgi:metal-dependent amidase/aminoacylase/carboxypeptidase family protein
MHACGHDGHMAMGLVTATVMNQIKDRISGTIKFVFQPAEEGPGGAKPMVDAGVMDHPRGLCTGLPYLAHYSRRDCRHPGR